MARRVQGEAKKVKASKQVPSTVMDMCEQELKNAARRYVTYKFADNPDDDKVRTQRGVLRGLATAYAMWYGSTPGQPKKDFIRETELRHVRDARQVWERENAVA